MALLRLIDGLGLLLSIHRVAFHGYACSLRGAQRTSPSKLDPPPQPGDLPENVLPVFDAPAMVKQLIAPVLHSHLYGAHINRTNYTRQRRPAAS